MKTYENHNFIKYQYPKPQLREDGFVRENSSCARLYMNRKHKANMPVVENVYVFDSNHIIIDHQKMYSKTIINATTQVYLPYLSITISYRNHARSH